MPNPAATLQSSTPHSAARQFAAPARVNLLGEHTDYTGGFVLPMAIPFYTLATIAPSQTAACIFEAERFPGVRTLSLAVPLEPAGDWSDYAVGVLKELLQLGIKPAPFTLRLGGNVPLNSGLSSSASVEVATAIALLAHAGATLPAAELALLCQRAENKFANSPCGIMDQSVITSARAGHALLLDTRDLSCEFIPLGADTRIVVCNSMVKHSVAAGEYPIRRRQLEAGQQILRDRFPHIKLLRDATLQDLQSCQSAMSPESFLRCRHVISENARVLASKEAMRQGDSVELGKLMLAAHASQRDDFACSCEEIDFLVETAAALSGCLGARLTGGGFGGCTVNLVVAAQAESFASALKAAYFKRYGIHAETYICEAVDGAILHNENRA